MYYLLKNPPKNKDIVPHKGNMGIIFLFQCSEANSRSRSFCGGLFLPYLATVSRKSFLVRRGVSGRNFIVSFGYPHEMFKRG